MTYIITRKKFSNVLCLCEDTCWTDAYPAIQNGAVMSFDDIRSAAAHAAGLGYDCEIQHVIPAEAFGEWNLKPVLYISHKPAHLCVPSEVDKEYMKELLDKAKESLDTVAFILKDGHGHQ